MQDIGMNFGGGDVDPRLMLVALIASMSIQAAIKLKDVLTRDDKHDDEVLEAIRLEAKSRLERRQQLRDADPS